MLLADITAKPKCVGKQAEQLSGATKKKKNRRTSENIHNNGNGVTFQNKKCQAHLFMSFFCVSWHRQIAAHGEFVLLGQPLMI